MTHTNLSDSIGEPTKEDSSNRTPASEGAAARRAVGASRQSVAVEDSTDWFSGWRLMLLRLAVLVVSLVAWDVASGWLVRPVLVSSPPEVAETLWRWVEEGTLWEHLWATAQAVVAGFFLGAASGVVAGYLLGTFVRVGKVLSPFVTALYTLPRLALAPLFILWFGLGLQFKVMFSAVIVFFLVFFTTRQGVEEVPRDLVNSVRIMGGKRRDIAVRVVLPSALIWVATGLKISVPYALVGVVVGEMLVGNTGLGFLLAQSANRFDPAGLFAAIVVLLCIAIIVDSALNRLTSRFLRWKTMSSVT